MKTLAIMFALQLPNIYWQQLEPQNLGCGFRRLTAAGKNKISEVKNTHHFEVLWSALCAVEVAGQQHVVNVVTGTVVEFQHVKRSRLEILEVSFQLQAFQNALLHEMYVPNLIPRETEKSALILHAKFMPFNLAQTDESAVS